MDIKTENLVIGITELDKFKDIDRCLSAILHKTQEHVIGYLKGFDNNFIAIIECNEHTVKTYEVGSSFGLTTDMLPIVDGTTVVLFPDGKKMSDMLKDPINFHEWCKNNNIC